jgi:hypothetical protein
MADKFYKWNKDNIFFLTREEYVEVTAYGHPKLEDGSLYYYSCQIWYGYDGISDEFGRNEIDRQFVLLCNNLFVYFSGQEEFKSLSCKKIGERYVVRLESSKETLEMGLSEMIDLFDERNKND